ncbi:hypothetical protein CCMA1212_006370 [Trichoderma ghanense]|uniref:Uncharacterized protein n=1 Tax=Trichoderma ghanense TaxID=65468 RepID=A0ABY2H0C1_9HYPO
MLNDSGVFKASFPLAAYFSPLGSTNDNLAKQLLALHQQRRNGVNATTDANEDKRPLHGLCDGQDGRSPQVSRNLLKDATLRAGNGTLNVSGGKVGSSQGGSQVLRGLRLKDLAGDDEGDDGAANLGDVLQGEGVAHLRGGDLERGDGISDLKREAGADGSDDGEAVDVSRGRARVEVRGEQGAAEGDEEARDGEDGHVVAHAGEQVAGGEVEADGEDDKGEQADGGLDGGVAVDELEVDGDEVDDDEEGGDVGRGGDVEQELGAGAQQVDGERAVLGRREEAERLLEGEADGYHDEGDDGGDGAAVVPGPLAAGHGEGHAEGDPGADAEEDAEEVNLLDALEDGDADDGVDRGQAEDVDGGKGAADDEVDVKGPAPGRARLDKGAADDGAQDGADAPAEARAGDVDAALAGGRQRGEVVEAAHEDAAAAGAGDDAADDEGRHAGRGAAERGADLEEDHGRGKDPFHVEAGVEHAVEQDDGDGAQGEAGADPGQLLDVAKGLDHGALDVGRDGGVEAVDEGADVEGRADEEPAEAADVAGGWVLVGGGRGRRWAVFVRGGREGFFFGVHW